MDDSISRQAVLDAPVKMVSEGLEWIPVYHIKELPSAEPEIIRCRDCKYSQMTDDGECRFCKIWFAEEEHFLPGDYFCADAERKDNG